MQIISLICIILLLGCIVEALLLFKDQGIVAAYLCKACEMAANEGWKTVIVRAVPIIMGKIIGMFPHSLRVKTNNAEIVSVAFYPTGGMGDYIISSKLLDELMMYAPCEVDVFCEKMYFGRSIYGGRPNVRVLDYSEFERSRNSYDVALQIEHFVHVLNINKTRLEKLAPELLTRMNYILDNWKNLYVNIPEQCWRERIRFEQCRALGLNRWTELRMGQAFEVKDLRTGIPLDITEKENALQVCDGRYVTINCGTDQMRQNMKQLKTWPKEYYEDSIYKLKETEPDIKVIQLGGNDSEQLAGADIAVLGKSFEMTKWLIKKSSCHIDGEGGLVHLAVQMSTPCVVVFGPTPMHMYGYPQNINLVDPECNGCMGTHEDWAYQCFRGEADASCMKKVLPDMVLDACREILKKGSGNKKQLRELEKEICLQEVTGKVAIIGNVDLTYLELFESDKVEIVIFSAGEDEIMKKTQCLKMGVDYRYSMTEALAYDNDSFDTVIVWNCELNDEALEEITRIMRVGAELAVKRDLKTKLYLTVDNVERY